VIGNDEVTSDNTGRSYGVEFLAQQKLWKGFYGILAYTFVRSEFKDRNDNFVPSSWDARHLISFTGGKKFKRNWELGLRWRFTGGTPYTPADIETSSRVAVWDLNRNALQDFTRLNEARVSEAHFLDLRVDKKWFFKKWALNIYLDIQNAYNFKAEQAPFYVQERNAQGAPIIIGEGDDARYQLREVSNPTGTVVPSFGIVVEI
jgi:hypothetical protein